MKKIFCLVVILIHIFITISYSGPMESYKNYNVILVHGAGGRYLGLDCGNDSKLKDASWYLSDQDKVSDKDERKDYQDLIGGYGEWLFFIDRDEEKSSANDMSQLRNWLTDNVFGGDKTPIYLQRPFTNPANSPVNNARELGDPKWKGNKNCEIRRSLIEEAQEVRANGRDNLINLRKSVENRNKLPPTRNILIAHSMGGVTSREYVQGDSYNNDVDKVITLDSPHEGTGALEMLLEMGDAQSRFADKETIILTMGILLASTMDVPTTIFTLYSLLPALGVNINTFAFGNALIKGLDKHYQKDDPLTPYINPSNSGGINDLRSRSYKDNLPMMRLLYGENSMTFSDPKGDKIASNFNGFVPKSVSSFFYNLGSQISGGGSPTVDFINSMTASTAGSLFGVTIGEHGTTLIPQKSGKAENTKAFDDPRADVM